MEIFNTVGPVVDFRLVFDRETNKPKGFGFCTYSDQETANSAVRNLNNYQISGRNLRVDYAETDKEAPAKKGQQQQSQGHAQQSQQQHQQNHQQQQQQHQQHQQNQPDLITQTVNSTTQAQMMDIFSQIKLMITVNPENARLLLSQNPQLSYGLLQSM